MTIKAGDLAVVVHQHCAKQRAIGLIVTVEKINPAHFLYCSHCRESVGRVVAAVVSNVHYRSGWMPLAWLKKIDPLSEPEHIERGEEMLA